MLSWAVMVDKNYISERRIIMKKFTTAEDEMIITNFITKSSKHENALCRWGATLYREGLLKGWAIGVGGCLIADYVTNKIIDKKSETK